MLRTKRLLLRDFEASDLEGFAAVLADERTMAPWDGPYDVAETERELRRYLDHRGRYGFAPFAVLLDGELVGDMGLQRLEDGDDVELLYRLSSRVWGRGLATEAGDATLEYAFSTLALREVVAVIAEDNQAPRRLAARLGFVRGELGSYYGRCLARHRVTPELHRRALAARTS